MADVVDDDCDGVGCVCVDVDDVGGVVDCCDCVDVDGVDNDVGVD